MDKITVVIPTFNRGQQLIQVVEHIIQSDVTMIEVVEILVIDDSSAIPAERFIEKNKINPPFSIDFIIQANAGPAAARNNGFRHAKYGVVLFMDDDILAFPDMLRKHMEGHNKYPGSVIYGYCPYMIPEKETPAYQFLKQLIDVNKEDETNNRFILTTSIASGNISVEKKMFPDGELYKSSLRTPAAEEFELMARLSHQNMEIYFNPSIKGWHLQPATIEDKCKQEYKYGIGIAEVALKVPYSLEHANLHNLYYENREVSKSDSGKVKLKKRIKGIIAKKQRRQFLLRVVKGIEFILPVKSILFPFYRMLAGIYVFAGVRDGLKKFNDTGKNQ